MKRLNYQRGVSPIIAVVLLAVILIGGGAYYFKQQQVTDQLTPEKFTQNIYNEYLTCVDVPLGQAPSSSSCLSKIKNKLSDDLIKEMTTPSSGPGYDHVLCAQDVPSSIGAVDKISATGDSASVIVHAIFGMPPGNSIKVELKSTNGTWKITKINCSPSFSEITANWKTYTNAQYGFEIKYPADTQCGQFSKNGNGDFNFGRIEIGVLNAGGLDLNSFVDKYLNQNSEKFNTIDSKNQVSINTRNAVTVAYRFGGTNKYGEMTFLKNNANIYVVGYTGGGFSCNEFTIFPQMLSTFKFIDQNQTIDTSTWKTYANTQYGFEIKYPADTRALKEGDQGLIASINLISSNSRLSSTGINVSVTDDKSCTAGIGTKIINGITFLIVRENTEDDAAGGERHISSIYHAAHNNKCLQIKSSVGYTSVEFSTTKPTSQEIQQEKDWIQTQQQLNNQILSSFKFLK